jgi:hypothetical protein
MKFALENWARDQPDDFVRPEIVAASEMPGMREKLEADIEASRQAMRRARDDQTDDVLRGMVAPDELVGEVGEAGEVGEGSNELRGTGAGNERAAVMIEEEDKDGEGPQPPEARFGLPPPIDL